VANQVLAICLVWVFKNKERKKEWYWSQGGIVSGLFQTLSDKISQLFLPLTSLAHWGYFVEF